VLVSVCGYRHHVIHASGGQSTSERTTDAHTKGRPFAARLAARFHVMCRAGARRISARAKAVIWAWAVRRVGKKEGV
jgi:hypothetical protein